jgi:hypothetical protein
MEKTPKPRPFKTGGVGHPGKRKPNKGKFLLEGMALSGWRDESNRQQFQVHNFGRSDLALDPNHE